MFTRLMQALGFGILLGQAVLAAEALPTSAPLSFTLTYQENGFDLNVDTGARDREIVFRKEPDFGSGEVLRGALKIGPGHTNILGFACDRQNRKLYLDLNRNLDLTDDGPAGVIEASSDDYYYEFTNLLIEAGDAPVLRRYRLDLAIRWSADVTVHSGWRGELELQGRKWILGVADDLDGVIGRRDELLLLAAEPPVSDTNPAPPFAWLPGTSRVFLQDRAYDVEFAFQGSPGRELICRLTEVTPPLGQLRVDGQFIRRLRLDGERTVILDNPSGTVGVPAGEYEPELFIGDAEGRWLFRGTAERLTVAPAAVAVLKAGGPLVNSVTIQRRGGSLQCEYALRGGGGEEYRCLRSPGTDRTAPKLIVRHKGAIVESGDFEYG